MKHSPFLMTVAAASLLLAGGCAVDDKMMGDMVTPARPAVGDVPAALADLIGARAGQAEGALTQRGYEYRNGSKSGDSSYSNYEELSSGECVTIRTEQGRYQSIIYGSKIDCEASDMTGGSEAEVGDVPAALADLVGARAGQAEGALMQRGYEYRTGSKSDDSSYTNWEELDTGECVTIRTSNGRYESIIYGSKLDCN